MDESYRNQYGTKAELNFDYVTTLILGPGGRKEDFDTELEGCACEKNEGGCTAESGCGCISMGLADDVAKEESDNMDNYDSEGRLLHTPTSSTPLFECGSHCQCSSEPESIATSPGYRCRNRVAQLGIRTKMKLVNTLGKGLGVVADEWIPHGTFIAEYAGEVISTSEAARRAREMAGATHHYIYTIHENFGGSTHTTHIDARHRGNMARFMNHSCDPNLFPQVLRMGSMVPHLCFFAVRDINKGEELCYSYGSVSPAISGKNGEQVEDATYAPANSTTMKQCLCGSTKCARTLPVAEF